MKNIFKKTLLVALIAALAMASLPFTSVSAQESDPPAPQGQVTNKRLEKVWAKELRVYERLGKGFERSDEFVEKLQSWIDRVTENGKDASGVQSALDAFEAAVNNAHPVYESAKGIVNAHQGFDENGKVTDSEKAKETVKSMGEKLKAIKDAMNGTGRALHEAIKDFREANPRPVETPTP
jgi:hypothetical protein